MRVKTWLIEAKLPKTLIVREDRHVAHPKYKKAFLKSKKFYVHVEDDSKFNEWEKVAIVASRPFSKLKRWIPLDAVSLDSKSSAKEVKK